MKRSQSVVCDQSREKQIFENSLQKPVAEAELLFCFDNIQEKDCFMLQLYHYAASNPEYAMLHRNLYIKKVSNVLRMSYKTEEHTTVIEDEKLLVDKLATVKTIITNMSLPNCYYKRKGQSVIYVPSEGQSMSLSQLLNCTYLLSKNSEYTKWVYGRNAKLSGIYKGIVLEKAEGSTEKEYVSAVMDYVVYQEESMAVKMVNLYDYWKIHVLCVWPQPKNYIKEYIEFLNTMDERLYDVTLIVTTSDINEVEDELFRIKDSVRILYIGEEISCSQALYQRIIRLDKELKRKRFEKLVGDFPEQEMQSEWTRLLGPSTFEISFLVSPQELYWYLMFLQLGSHHIVLVMEEPVRYSLLDKVNVIHGQANMVRLADCFDVLEAYDTRTLEGYRNTRAMSSCIIVSFDRRNCLNDLEQIFHSCYLSDTRQ